MHGKTLSIYFGDIHRMPYDLESPALLSSTFNEAVFGRLVQVDSDYAVHPALLSHFYFDSQKQGYVLELADHVSFHNGRKANAQDLEFSLLRGFYSRRSNFYDVFFGNIEGVKEVAKGTPFKSGAVTGVKILDDRHLLVKLSTPNPSFLHSLGNLLASLVPREELNDDLFTWKSLPVGTGPYRVGSVNAKEFAVTLTPLDKKLNGFELRFAKTKQPADISFEPANGYSRKTFQRPSSVAALFFSSANAQSRSRDFRLALGHAVDKKMFLDEQFSDAAQLLPPSFWGRAAEVIPRVGTPIAPPQLVRASVLSLSKDANPIVLRMKKLIEIAIVKIGAKAEVKLTPNKFWSARESVQCSLIGLSFITNYYDPLVMFKGMGPGSPTFGLFWEQDKTLVNLFKKAEMAPDYMTRLQTLRQLSRYVVEQGYVIPLGYKFGSIFVNPRTVLDVGPIDAPEIIHLEKVVGS